MDDTASGEMDAVAADAQAADSAEFAALTARHDVLEAEVLRLSDALAQAAASPGAVGGAGDPSVPADPAGAAREARNRLYAVEAELLILRTELADVLADDGGTGGTMTGDGAQTAALLERIDALSAAVAGSVDWFDAYVRRTEPGGATATPE